MSKSTEKRIETLNRRITESQHGMYSNYVFYPSIGVLTLGAGISLITASPAMAILSGLWGGTTTNVLHKLQKIRSHKAMNELHGYALEENMNYTGENHKSR